MDRDYNGARGIYLRALGDIPALRHGFQSAPRARLVPQPMMRKCSRKFLDCSTFIKEFLGCSSEACPQLPAD